MHRKEIQINDTPLSLETGKYAKQADGAVVVGGSHGAVYAAYLSAKAGVRAAIHNDAGIGRDDAGISGLAWAEAHGMAMAATLSGSARIGDGQDMLVRGIISRANPLAAACGVKPGQPGVVADLIGKHGHQATPPPHAVDRLPAGPGPERMPVSQV